MGHFFFENERVIFKTDGDTKTRGNRLLVRNDGDEHNGTNLFPDQRGMVTCARRRGRRTIVNKDIRAIVFSIDPNVNACRRPLETQAPVRPDQAQTTRTGLV